MDVVDLERRLVGVTPEVLEAIELILGKRKPKLKPKTTKLQFLTPHNLTFSYECGLCKWEWEEWFYMSPTQEKVLVGIRLDEKPIDGRVVEKKVRCCHKCESRLKEWEKDELITTLIKTKKERLWVV